MRIFSITPIHVPDDELQRRQRRYDQISPPGLTVELHDIGDHAPRALETPEDMRESERCVVAALRDAGPGYDALLPDCVLDPGVAELHGRLAVPVFGILRLTVGYAAATGRTAGGVTRNQAIADEFAAVATAYGFAGSLGPVSVLDLDLDAIADDARWVEALGKAVDGLADGGAHLVVNGCSAVDLDGADPYRVPVVDPTALALRLLAAGEVA
jgi:Asp/Glu/hydantoin racemase